MNLSLPLLGTGAEDRTAPWKSPDGSDPGKVRPSNEDNFLGRQALSRPELLATSLPENIA